MPHAASIGLLFLLLTSAAGAETRAVSALPVVIHPSAGFHRDEAVSRREANGRHGFDASVNGTALHLVFDTGASHVTIRAEDAAQVGIDAGTLRYTAISNTANGRAEVALVTLASVTVGGITRRNVAALVSRPGSLSVNLLGQSFLTRLAGYRLEGAELVLSGGE